MDPLSITQYLTWNLPKISASSKFTSLCWFILNFPSSRGLAPPTSSEPFTLGLEIWLLLNKSICLLLWSYILRFIHCFHKWITRLGFFCFLLFAHFSVALFTLSRSPSFEYGWFIVSFLRWLLGCTFEYFSSLCLRRERIKAWIFLPENRILVLFATLLYFLHLFLTRSLSSSRFTLLITFFLFLEWVLALLHCSKWKHALLCRWILLFFCFLKGTWESFGFAFCFFLFNFFILSCSLVFNLFFLREYSFLLLWHIKCKETLGFLLLIWLVVFLFVFFLLLS